MAQDLDDISNADPSIIVSYDKSVAAKVSPNRDVGTADVLDSGGLDTVLALTTSPSEGRVGGTPKANRKYFIMEALDNNVKWGFSNTTQSFDIFKSQLIMVPCGPNTSIWFKMSSGTGSVAIGEVS